MEAKKFISTLKGFRTRFTNNANPELEKKSVEALVEKFGGKLEVIATLKETESDLLGYVRKVLGIVHVTNAPSEETPKIEAPVSKETKKTSEPTEEKQDTKVISNDGKGNLYEIDTIKKTCRRVLKDLSQLSLSDIDIPEMPMTTYLRYLKDKFPGEGAQIKKDKLYFRSYRVSCTPTDGFMIEDGTKRYAVVETEFEGIPTPKELGEFFNRPRVEHTTEELQAAVELGKELARKAKEESLNSSPVQQEDIDYEVLQKKVLAKIHGIQQKKVVDFDPELFGDMIPGRKWKRKVNALLKDWKERKIRYGKFLSLLEKFVTEESFDPEEKEANKRSSFVGAILPEFKNIGILKGNEIEVDGKFVPAVPFILDYMLHYDPKAMPQIMRFAQGEVSDVQLLKNPYHVDARIEYKKQSLPNTANGAQVLTALCASIGLVAPQDLLYVSDLVVGDKIMLFDENGEWKTKTISKIENGIEINNGIGLLKLDKWIKLPNTKKDGK